MVMVRDLCSNEQDSGKLIMISSYERAPALPPPSTQPWDPRPSVRRLTMELNEIIGQKNSFNPNVRCLTPLPVRTFGHHEPREPDGKNKNNNK